MKTTKERFCLRNNMEPELYKDLEEAIKWKEYEDKTNELAKSVEIKDAKDNIQNVSYDFNN